MVVKLNKDRWKDLRGRNRMELSKKNRENILKWLKENPDKGMMDCSRELNLSYPTVRKHINEIQKPVQESKSITGLSR